MALLLLVCFLPSGILLAGYLGGESPTAVWTFRAGFFVLEAILVIFVMRMLLAWQGGRPIYLLLASASAALLFATKETTFITLGTMIIAIPCILIWQRIYGKRPAEFEDGDGAITWSNFRAAAGEGTELLLLIGATMLVFLYVNALFFSSFFTYPDGIKKAFEAYAIWTQTGTKDHTQSGFWAYLKWSFGYGQSGSKLETAVEAAVIVLAAAGTATAFFLGRNRVAMFIGLWAVGLFLAYSLIPYKTPWLALSFLLPMCLIAGYAINELINRASPALRYGGIVVGAAACVLLAYQSYRLNFVNYDNNDRTYVYAHTKREFLTMMSRIEHYATKSGKGRETVIDIVSPDYWPMVWYTNDFPKAVYHGRMIDNSNAEVIVGKKNDQDREMIARYSSKYKLVGTYPLRPGVDLVLLVRNDLAEPGDQDLYRLRNP
jgi:uncharacterized protein (TIGR03663 family)